jgi:hypothetical protein
MRLVRYPRARREINKSHDLDLPQFRTEATQLLGLPAPVPVKQDGQ